MFMGSSAKNGSAVVIGGSIAGLVAARALSETFEQVTVLERDELPADPQPRRGVPQSRQLHVLLAGGAKVLEELFPGFTSALVEAGALCGDPQVDTTYYLDGRPLARAASGTVLVAASRPLVEHVIRERVAKLPNVRTVRGEALDLLTAPGGATVTGVRTDRDDQPELRADLVVDAAGRGSRALKWLAALGIAEPEASRVQVDVVYTTRMYESEPHQLDGRQGLLVVPYPGVPRGAAIMRLEGDRIAVTLFGLAGQDPPTTEDGMLEYAGSLPVPDVRMLMAEAKPLGDAVKMRYPESVRRHFEKLPKHLDGFIVMGDALCNFNPTYGQGISVAAMEAVQLRQLTRSGTTGLPARFYGAAAKVIDGAWALAAGGDLRFPEIPGNRTAADRMLNRYLDKYRLAASVDPVLGKTFIEVANMLAPATALVSPGHLLRVFRAARKARAQN
jgi:2-polyprenyl-6-methoxyphenol hydroxylase-like FAD-dependent oxidoreductase